ncbi:MAG: GTP pyrophosphokinase [Alphaproteobacteria bacterium RIFCSPLOWO2_01_FULL_45_8]|nr:MAG: GTP pyrophosphokinase [Alphaproteobacteria bacterium GWA1_45_9]OFW90021.1 MAG: GTP pyrophosphokinase [Alphaproteobacteria bacterium RIFCSPHIGHO2_01_FULL_41_14]OFW96268.1 MAG: GTP pyrophosphokinase [Alphaproteobacteria bacterium RIFCSPLOWO2_01_FULL_45_8]HCI49203.1 bifunctional (p)ppGpp synthetase/guanosine-3',5'-bis(diphosphate) 3'-pyrophosphohydrolase [Holosporales bacterium]
MSLNASELVNKVLSYAPRADAQLIKKAYDFAEAHHVDQKRASGEPYIMHPLAVAEMLADLKMDVPSVIAGLLHDTVEDTAATLKDVEKIFGSEITSLVQGVTKLARIGLQSTEQKQAENFRRLVLAMSDDIRILMIKLCDRLHNMRTIKHVQSEESRRRVALETLEIYAPLSERIGMKGIQEELHDLSFSQLNPEAYTIITNRIRHLHQLDKSTMSFVVQDLGGVMQKAGIKATVTGREKSPYSIWRKMQNKNVSFEQLCDVVAFRILVDSIADCYHALGIIHNEFFVIPGRFKDYISTPKPNNYQSLHTYVIGPKQRQIEIQIRTYAMQEVAEYGVAAHWQYKQGIKPKEGKQYRWVRGLLDILEHAAGDDEFLEHTKLEMFHDQVFCFTPYGDLIALRRGSTPVDFAYAVHSDIGNRCKGAKINGKLMPLRTELRNGDQVEIVISPGQNPSPTWERFVVTGKAKTNIRRFLRSKKRSQFLSTGKSIFLKELQAIPKKKVGDILPKLLKKFQLEEEDFYASLGEGVITTRELENVIHPSEKKESVEGAPVTLAPAKGKLPKKPKPKSEIKGLVPGMVIHYAGCCHPLPGESIVGLVTTGKGVTIHKEECEDVEGFQGDVRRLLNVSWGPISKEDMYVSRIFAVLYNTAGSLGEFTTVIGQKGGNISDIKITRRNSDLFDFSVDLMVHDLNHLSSILESLRMSEVVHIVERI